MRLLFDGFVFDSGERSLRRAASRSISRRRRSSCSRSCCASGPQAISRADLVRELWPATFVADGSLANLASELRAALADPPGEARLLRTVHRFGYAFCGTVKEEQAISRCRLLGPERDFPLLRGREPDRPRQRVRRARRVLHGLARARAPHRGRQPGARSRTWRARTARSWAGRAWEAGAACHPATRSGSAPCGSCGRASRPESATDSYHAAGD